MGERIIKKIKNDCAVKRGILMPAACGAFFVLLRIAVSNLFSAVAFVGFLPHPALLLLGVSLLAGGGCVIWMFLVKELTLYFTDIAVLIFGTQILLSGLWGLGGTASLFKSLLSFALIMVAFLASVTIDDNDRERAISAIIASSAVSAIVGVWQIFNGGYESGWLDSSAFSGISVRITSLFGNPNVYSAYLLLVMPFVLHRVIDATEIKKKLLYCALLILLVLCMVQTWSRGAWLGLLLELFVFLMFYKRRLVPYILIALPFFAVAVSLFAPNVWTRLISIGDLSDTSVSYRISAWRGVLKMLSDNNFFGIGYGEPAFLEVYPLYAYSGATAVRHSHSLYLQIMTGLGAVGLIIFAIVIFSVLARCIGNTREKTEIRGVSIAGATAVLGSLFMGLTDHIWYDQRIFFLFWLVIGLTRRKESVNDCEI